MRTFRIPIPPEFVASWASQEVPLFETPIAYREVEMPEAGDDSDILALLDVMHRLGDSGSVRECRKDSPHILTSPVGAGRDNCDTLGQ